MGYGIDNQHIGNGCNCQRSACHGYAAKVEEAHHRSYKDHVVKYLLQHERLGVTLGQRYV